MEVIATIFKLKKKIIKLLNRETKQTQLLQIEMNLY